MAGRIDARLRELDIELPEPQGPKVAMILPATIADRWLFVSGQITQWNGEHRFIGKVGREFDLAAGQQAARLSALNVLAQAKKVLDGDLDRIERVVQLKGYVNATPDFTQLSEMVNGASELMIEVFGEAGHHARTAIGAAVMPFDVAIEVEARFLLR
jgi:enamine deaminase RidA (YjgF/YER057c/UK114 family)